MHKIESSKPLYKRWWAISCFVILGLIILASIGGNKNSQPANTQSSQNRPVNTESSQPPTSTTPSEEKTYSIGEPIQAGDFKWTITNVSTETEVGEEISGTLIGEKADGIYIIFDVEVENTGSSAKLLMDSFLKLVDDQNREFSPDSTAAFYLKPQGSALMFEQINPGIKKKGKIVFDVPPNLKVVNLKIENNAISSSYSNMKMII